MSWIKYTVGDTEHKVPRSLLVMCSFSPDLHLSSHRQRLHKASRSFLQALHELYGDPVVKHDLHKRTNCYNFLLKLVD